ncbi:MAG: hypothetical protein ACREQV_18955 [Candidatus Binatia bacterium]
MLTVCGARAESQQPTRVPRIGFLSAVEPPKQFEFIINLKAAQQIGLTIPQKVLVKADKVIR